MSAGSSGRMHDYAAEIMEVASCVLEWKSNFGLCLLINSTKNRVEKVPVSFSCGPTCFGICYTLKVGGPKYLEKKIEVTSTYDFKFDVGITD